MYVFENSLDICGTDFDTRKPQFLAACLHLLKLAWHNSWPKFALPLKSFKHCTPLGAHPMERATWPRMAVLLWMLQVTQAAIPRVAVIGRA